MPTIGLDTGDAAELAELLQFVHNWLTADHHHLARSLQAFVGNPSYTISDLHNDLARFTFLLGGNDGEPLFQPSPPTPQP